MMEDPEDYNIKIDEMVNKIDDFLENNISYTDRELFRIYYKMGKYDRMIGRLRDRTCQKPISSTRKVENKLTLKETVIAAMVECHDNINGWETTSTEDEMEKYYQVVLDVSEGYGG
jgi:hypothetical protein